MPDPAEKTTPASLTNLFPILGILLSWGILITQARHHWGGESYYNFGWFVPFMAAWLMVKNLSGLERAPLEKKSWHLLLASLVILLVVPFQALSEVNPFWRVPLWAQALGFAGFSFIAIHILYGWKGVRAAVFPLFFISTMIPWPYRMETQIVQLLTEVVVALAMNGLHFLGYPVELAGNSFVLGSLNIGVNEACSGIRSLQALFMVTLFLGSLFGQGYFRRAAAVLILPLIVILVNTGRAVFLALQLIENGEEAYDGWHDPAGYIAFGISMVLIYACIEIFNIGSDSDRSQESLSLNRIFDNLKRAPLARSAVVFTLLPIMLWGLVEAWFRYHEARAPRGVGWELSHPQIENGSAEFVDIHPQIETALGYDYGERFFYTLSPRSWCEVYYYGYNSENKLASVSSYGHSPTICMQSTGATMVEQFSSLIVRVPEGPNIPLKHYLFELRDSQKELHVFWVVWEHRNMNISAENLESLNYRTQWVQLLHGRRDFSRQVLLLSITGMETQKMAREAVRNLLTDWLVEKPG